MYVMLVFSAHRMSGAVHECAVCLNQLCEPVRWPASPDTKCTHTFCRLCAYKVLRYKTEESGPASPKCPICRAPAIDGAQWAGEGALVLDAAVQEQVLSSDAERHRMQQIAHTAELQRMHADEFKVALHPFGEFVLRKGQRIEMPLYRSSLGWVAQVLASPRRNFGLVLASFALSDGQKRSRD